MTLKTHNHRHTPSFRGWEPAMAVVGAALLVAMIPTGWLALIDDRTLNDVGIWDKPLKFQLSTGLFLLMASWVSTRLPAGWRHTPAGRYVVWAAILSTLFEVGYIAFQASRGQASHFNYSNGFTIAMYGLMGAGAVILTSTALVQGIGVLRHDAGDPPAFRRALGWGLVLTFLLGTATGAYMSAQMSGHWVGGPASDAGGLPFLGWSTTAGDLRPPHFLGIHAAQILPVTAVILLAVNRRHADLLTRLAIATYVAVTVAVFWQAVSGLPLIAL
jgi:hypothetical protein